MSFACTSKLSSLQLLTLKSCSMDECMDIWMNGCMKGVMKGHTGIHYRHTCISINLARSFWYGSYIWVALKNIAMKNCTLLKWVINCNEWLNDLLKFFSLYFHFLLKYTSQNSFRNYCICIITCPNAWVEIENLF